MRIAFLSPLPPARSGVAHYASVLLPALREKFDVTAFGSAAGYRAGAFDAAIYQLGNNPHHEFVFNEAMRTPGIAVLHDVVLHHLIVEMTLARGDGRYGRLLKTLGRVQVLILDDWGLSVLTQAERRDLLEILDDRHGRASTIVTSQVPVDTWHDLIGDPTLADAILDRLVHNAHRLELTGESLRKRNGRSRALDGVSNS